LKSGAVQLNGEKKGTRLNVADLQDSHIEDKGARKRIKVEEDKGVKGEDKDARTLF
jgi:hypothetical protein